jgi:hypothetical protein
MLQLFSFPCHQFNRIGWRKMFSGEFIQLFFSVGWGTAGRVIISLGLLCGENALKIAMNNGWWGIQICLFVMG